MYQRVSVKCYQGGPALEHFPFPKLCRVQVGAAHPNAHRYIMRNKLRSEQLGRPKDGLGRVGIEAMVMESTLAPEDELQGPALRLYVPAHALQPVVQCLIFVRTIHHLS